MKQILVILVIAIIVPKSFAVSFLPHSRRIQPTPDNHALGPKKRPMEDKVVRTDSATVKLNEKIQKLMEATQANAELLKQRSSRPLIYDGASQIQTTQVFKGTLLNSVRSTNLDSPIVVRVDDGEGLPQGTKFDCTGITKYKRVQTFCQRIILPGKTLPVNVTILNEDGSSGLTGKYYDGKEALIAGTVMMAGVGGLIASKQQTLNTSLGSVTQNDSRNQALGVGLSMANAATDIMKSEIDAKEPIVYIEAGKRILIYFRDDFSFRKRTPLVDIEEIKNKTTAKNEFLPETNNSAEASNELN